MIPLQLTLSNFLSYRDTVTVDLGEIHLAVISGANGAGKSTLLDAMTWTLFGRSRSRSDDDLVNRQAAVAGQMAEVTFTFNMEGAIYRVIRRKQVQKTAMLELQVAQGEGDEPQWLSLTEGKLRETQAAVERVLRMNYDVFTNASFFLQGQADEFTTKTPNQRKEILAEVLGVTQWETYREQAAERRKEAMLQLGVQERQLDEIDAELAEAVIRAEELARAEQAVDTIRQQLQVQQQLQDQMAKNRAAAERQEDQVATMAANRERLEVELVRLEQVMVARQGELEDHLSLMKNAATIRQTYEMWREADGAWANWQLLREQYLALREKRRPHETRLAAEESRLRQDLLNLETRSNEIAASVTRKAQLLEEQRQLGEKRTTLEQTAAELAGQLAARGVLEKELQELLADRRLWQQEQAQLQSRAQEVAKRRSERALIEANIGETRHKLERSSRALEAAESRAEQAQTAELELKSLTAEQERLRNDMTRLKQRLSQLSVDEGSKCPLCGQELTQTHREEVVLELEAEGKERGDAFRANRVRLEQMQARATQLAGAASDRASLFKEVEGLRQRLTTAELSLAETGRLIAEWEAGEEASRLTFLTDKLADETAVQERRARLPELEPAAQTAEQTQQALQAAHTRETQLTGLLVQIDEATAAWEKDGQARLVALRAALDSSDFAHEVRAALAALDAAEAGLGFNPADFEAARAKVMELASAQAAFQALKEAEAAVNPVRVAVVDLQTRHADLAEQLAEQQRQHDEAISQLAELSELSRNWREVEAETMRLQEAVSQADQQLGASKQRVLVLDDRRKQAEALRDKGAAIGLRIQRLQRLEKALGRNGIQALLIEHALPEIEEHANSLLDRLTGGEMQVSFETQRQLKSRDELSETLEIRIRDSFGERPYENYSGGEQFRVDFAIRLALSQVLAQRAGAKLRTLVIDEGFGSQDPQGRQRLVEAINTVQSDFDCILVITHITELRDSFPARIVVEKGARGSAVEVNVL